MNGGPRATKMRATLSPPHYDNVTARCAVTISSAKHYASTLCRHTEAVGFPSACCAGPHWALCGHRSPIDNLVFQTHAPAPAMERMYAV